jgi:hypothetical protein
MTQDQTVLRETLTLLYASYAASESVVRSQPESGEEPVLVPVPVPVPVYADTASGDKKAVHR